MKKPSIKELRSAYSDLMELEWLAAVETATAFELAFYTGDTTGLKLLGKRDVPFKK